MQRLWGKRRQVVTEEPAEDQGGWNTESREERCGRGNCTHGSLGPRPRSQGLDLLWSRARRLVFVLRETGNEKSLGTWVSTRANANRPVF